MPNDKVGQDAFAVIREAMKGKDMVGVGRVVISKRERPIILEPFGKGMRGMTLRYPYEVRDEDEYFADIPDVKISGEMLKLAEHIIETKTADFDPTEFVDHYEDGRGRDAEEKAGRQGHRQERRRVPLAPQDGNVIDLLKRSMEMEGKKGKEDKGSVPCAGDAKGQSEDKRGRHEGPNHRPDGSAATLSGRKSRS